MVTFCEFAQPRDSTTASTKRKFATHRNHRIQNAFHGQTLPSIIGAIEKRRSINSQPLLSCHLSN